MFPLHALSILDATVLNNNSTKRAVTELFANLGFFFLLVDMELSGDLREKVIVLYHRLIVRLPLPSHSQLKPQNRFVDPLVRSLFCSTSFVKGQEYPKKYPFSYFERCHFPESLILPILDLLSSCDLYDSQRFFNPSDSMFRWSLARQCNQAYTPFTSPMQTPPLLLLSLAAAPRQRAQGLFAPHSPRQGLRPDHRRLPRRPLLRRPQIASRQRAIAEAVPRDAAACGLLRARAGFDAREG